MLVLGVESTAHTFSIGVVKDGVVLGQLGKTYIPPGGGGIHPREAAEHHARVAPSILRQLLGQLGVGLSDIGAVAYAAGPGLGPALRVGAVLARALAIRLGVPVVPVHHGVAHIEVARYATGACDPLVVLISGGHTVVAGYSDGRYRVFGETLDVAIGNAIDMFAREVGLGFPGVPAVEKCAESAETVVPFPMPIVGQDLSYAGLATHALQLVKRGVPLPVVCRSLVETAYYMLAEVVERALAYTRKREVVVAGGVARSRRLKEILRAVGEEHGAVVKVVPDEYAGDNGAMIALTGYYAYRRGVYTTPEGSFVRQRWRLDSVDVPWFRDLCPVTTYI
ncbi:KEOPS complex N(6)-L-threonylcarbamoyladenine synthase Kae1 [Pyrobaculum neutrophilum]|uniref:tRNA N6-adenosine threonylcarbamoyltransferase n=1 Tax=Pyrobaculum neutrophilum (strain DSM 2338 / JCM 9278 / NBRC 100436 / V24Sta) TaxID=444157 RepID=KAE1_PYRNV|nr:KEOPS complex N(6)-L-threonylcarbamoyladenine synthase Kae1 [Pyrobaculum neutrophilum]B1Y8P8.1 RecName: Full=tRNA N6-adenosine threonylcarbamoyltransferase; AltName: Full=N6-L-threonylcarbamoyladenine synthase; Short=t(6)A synthase; AltName: Full=t(6)A37 threonylcarbamoyladenosine biosynthesis protein Kae1; AltName: Full=tRNA threonylcarbamoyladenosine biosynthesis protein Kae1 [Pyrobaculum neutrophilum V24Sta]ACB40127.1 metalloendopeptidase, glycoprotease family [Pyrobaculum neutrophilum V24S